MRSVYSVIVSFASVVLLGACSGGGGGVPKCTPGVSIECACPTGENGAQTCGSDGEFNACVCAAGGVGGASAPVTSSGAAGVGGTSLGGAGGASAPLISSGTAGFGGTSLATGVPGGATTPGAGSITATGGGGGATTPGSGSITGGLCVGTESPCGGYTNGGGGTESSGGRTSAGGSAGSGGVAGKGGVASTRTSSTTGGAVGTGGTNTPASPCGNGVLDPGEQCDCGVDASKLPVDCRAKNGVLFGDGTGCKGTCIREPRCLGDAGQTQACTAACGDGNVEPGEGCDDGNLLDGDGCSSACALEAGFTCATRTVEDAEPCASGNGRCLQLSMIYRDFQSENVAAGGHPDFAFLGTRHGGSAMPTTICVPNSAGPAKGNDSTARCWGIAADSLLNGKPQPGPTKTCACQFSDWSFANSSRIPDGYTHAGNDSPLSDGKGGFQGPEAGSTVNTVSTAGEYRGTLIRYTGSSPGGPVWKGTVPAYKDAASFLQWFADEPAVNQTFTGTLELASISTSTYRYASEFEMTGKSTAGVGFFPLDALNPRQTTQCDLWPYWNHGKGTPIWGTCSGDQYLFSPRVSSSNCVSGDTLEDGCWVTDVSGSRRNYYFTVEARTTFVYDGSRGLAISFYGDDDLFVFINGKLVLDLGGIHQPLPGKVTVSGNPGDATVIEGGCLDSVGTIMGASAGSTVCAPSNLNPKPPAATPDDFRSRKVSLGLETGKVYELAIFGADRHPPESNFQLTIQGLTRRRSECSPSL